MSNRAKFTASQLQTYFSRIQLPPSSQHLSISTLSPSEQLAYLTLLCKHHLICIPWENLTQHYSFTRSIQTHPSALFTKIASSTNSRGGYCMETNHLLHIVLFSLGFHAYLSGSRIYHTEQGTFGGWTHVVNLVRLPASPDRLYMLDGGFGSGGAPRPVPVVLGDEADALRERELGVDMGLGTKWAEVRVVRRGIGQNVDQGQRMWVYQFRFRPHVKGDEGGDVEVGGEETQDIITTTYTTTTYPTTARTRIEQDAKQGWQTGYCFTDLEFLPEDIAGMNFAPWLNPRTFFTHKVVAVRFTTEAEREEYPGAPKGEEVLGAKVDGAIVLDHSTLRWRRKGKTVAKLTFRSESERVLALERYFGIVLSDEEQAGIRDSAAMLGAKAMGHE